MSVSEQRKMLIELRSSLLSEKQTLPYCIFKDEEIENLLKAQPKSLPELWKVKGFPKEGKRVKGFGQAIVDIFNGVGIQKFDIQRDSKGEVNISVVLKKATGFGN